MIDNNIFISSATLIPDMYNDYNIQSDDFVSRFLFGLQMLWKNSNSFKLMLI